MVRCIKCEREAERDHIAEEEGKSRGCDFFASVEINHDVMGHAGSQTIVYHGDLCWKCLEYLSDNRIITQERQ